MEKNMRPLCIYHGGCDDGFAAAWCVRKGLRGEVDFYPGVYQKEPPPHEGRDVIFVDFSYKRPILDAMAMKANSILILDHHKTAAEDLSDIPGPTELGSYPSPMRAIFDMERSGAALAWDFFIGTPRPSFIEYIQDRDLWRKQLPQGDEFTIALRSYPQDFATWDALVAAGAPALIKEGYSIQRYYRLRVEELKRSGYAARIGQDRCYVANAPYFAASEVAGELSTDEAFGACYFEAEGGRWQYSLRSRGAIDVSAVARRYGGGGHKAAAGFSADAPVHVAL
jgi:uncharacterized protein